MTTSAIDQLLQIVAPLREFDAQSQRTTGTAPFDDLFRKASAHDSPPRPSNSLRTPASPPGAVADDVLHDPTIQNSPPSPDVPPDTPPHAQETNDVASPDAQQKSTSQKESDADQSAGESGDVETPRDEPREADEAADVVVEISAAATAQQATSVAGRLGRAPRVGDAEAEARIGVGDSTADRKENTSDSVPRNADGSDSESTIPAREATTGAGSHDSDAGSPLNDSADAKAGEGRPSAPDFPADDAPLADDVATTTAQGPNETSRHDAAEPWGTSTAASVDARPKNQDGTRRHSESRQPHAPEASASAASLADQSAPTRENASSASAASAANAPASLAAAPPATRLTGTPSVEGNVPVEGPHSVSSAATAPADANPSSDLRATGLMERLATSRGLGNGTRTENGAPSSPAERAQFVLRVSGAVQRAQLRDGPIRVRLSPPELGSLRIEMTVQQGVMTASIEAETSAARALLIENLPQLRERLAEQDIRIERFDVDLHRDDQRGSNFQSADDRRDQRDLQHHQRSEGVSARQASLASAHVGGVSAETNSPEASSDARIDVRI